MDQGIVLLTMARSRSSMTAEIFREHGVFFGDVWRPREGFDGYNEHIELKKVARKARPDCYKDILANRDPFLKIPGFPEYWERTMEGDGYRQGPWGVKVDAFCSELWPNHLQIGIWRNPDGIRESCLRTFPRRFSEKEWDCIISAHHRQMEALKIHMIDTNAVLRGFYGTLERAFKLFNMSFDPKIADRVIDK